MKVCFINYPAEHYTTTRPGAIAIVIQGLTRELAKRGHDVVVITRESDDPPLEGGRVVTWHEPSGSLASRLRMKMTTKLHGGEWGYYKQYCSEVCELARSERPDFAATHNDPSSAGWLKNTGAGKTAIWFHNKINADAGKHKDLSGVDFLVAPSPFLAGWVSDNYVAPSGGVSVVPNGVDPATFHARHRDERHGPLRVLFVGRFDANKGIDLVVDAVAQLAREDIPVDLTLVGGGWWWDSGPPSDPYAVAVLSKAEMLGAKFLGRLTHSELGDLYRTHDVVCIPSRDQEGFSLVAAEAMACGCAIVSSRLGGLGYACGDADILVDTDDSSQLADVLRRLSADTTALKVAQERADRRGSELTWERATDALLATLQS